MPFVRNFAVKLKAQIINILLHLHMSAYTDDLVKTSIKWSFLT